MLDFDHTLFDTDLFFNVDVRAVFDRFGITQEVWEASSGRAIERGYSLAAHAHELRKLGCNHVKFAEQTKVLQEEFSDLSRYVYADVVENLRRARNRGWELALVSFGDANWQQHKLVASGLAEWFGEHAFFTATHGSKAEVIERQFYEYEHVVFVDNRGAELDAIKARASRTLTYHICRVPERCMSWQLESERVRYLEARRIFQAGAQLNHTLCTTLNQVEL
jgi:FMN phosphatase YigB (HAD superfamily)